jgi:hypothetical protein
MSTRKRYIPYKHEIFSVFLYTIEKMKTGGWNQEEMIKTAKWFMEIDGHGGYNPPNDLEDKIEWIAGRIRRRIFEFPRMTAGHKRSKKNIEIEGYDYVYKHYIFTVLLHFKHHIRCQFDFTNYQKIVEKNISEHGCTDYKPADISGELLDKIITLYKKRIFDYPAIKGGIQK